MLEQAATRHKQATGIQRSATTSRQPFSLSEMLGEVWLACVQCLQTL